MKVILINGEGTVGKDTVVKFTTQFLKNKYYVRNISTIDTTKKLAKKMGWNECKDEKGRQFLADLKEAWTKYNNGANKEVLEKISFWHYWEDLMPKKNIVFLHVREPESLEWFLEKIKAQGIEVCSLLVRRDSLIKFSNKADQNTNNFNYDIILDNNSDFHELKQSCNQLSEMIKKWCFTKNSENCSGDSQ